MLGCLCCNLKNKASKLSNTAKPFTHPSIMIKKNPNKRWNKKKKKEWQQTDNNASMLLYECVVNFFCKWIFEVILLSGSQWNRVEIVGNN